MPSVYQQSAGRTWERTDLGNRLMTEFDEDIERFLYGGGVQLACARIVGIDDVDLLRAYTKVEASREARREIIAAVNARIKEVREKA